MAKAQPTSRLMSKRSTMQAEDHGHRPGHDRPPAGSPSHRCRRRTRPGPARRPPRSAGPRRWTGRRRRRRPPPGPTAARRPRPGKTRPGRARTTVSVAAGQVQVRGVEAAEGAVDGGEDVEGAEEHEHDQGRLPGGPPVGVGVEADEDVGQAHRAQERGQHERVGEEQRVAPLVADRARTGGSRSGRRRRGWPTAWGAARPAGKVSSVPGRRPCGARAQRQRRGGFGAVGGCRRASPFRRTGWAGRPRSGRRPRTSTTVSVRNVGRRGGR